MSAEAGRPVIVDVNFFENLRRVDPDCGLLDLICDCYQGQAMGDGPQLGVVDYCEGAVSKLECVRIRDEAIAEFVFAHEGSDLQKTFKDPVDIKLLAFAVSLPDCILLTCDTKLLETAAHYNIERACFKAAIAYANRCLGNAIVEDPAYATGEMYSPGPHPFIHYGNDKHCPRCDPKRSCDVRQDL